jgi:hypothetical protein
VDNNNQYAIWDFLDRLTGYLPNEKKAAKIKREAVAAGGYQKGVVANWAMLEDFIVTALVAGKPCFSAHKVVQFLMEQNIDRALTKEELKKALSQYCPPPRKMW